MKTMMRTSSENRFKFDMSKCSILSSTPKNVAFVRLVIEFEARDSELGIVMEREMVSPRIAIFNIHQSHRN